MRRFTQIMLLMLVAALLGGCAAAEGGAQEKLSIVVTDFPCYDFARQVAGERAEVRMLIHPGAEVHTYEPTPMDIIAIREADLFICIGGESDSWVEGILSAQQGGPQVLRMMEHVEAQEEEIVEGMQVEDEHDHEEEDTEYDEHIWTSPKNAARMVGAVRDALSAMDTANAETYNTNAEAYIAQIDALDAQLRTLVENAARRELIFGDRFPFLYFAREYGLSYYAAFPGCSSAAEPSAQVVAWLIDRVRADGVPVVYAIELSRAQIAQTIAAETGAEVLVMHSCQTVSLDDFEAGETYVSLMQRNVQALEKGLN